MERVASSCKGRIDYVKPKSDIAGTALDVKC